MSRRQVAFLMVVQDNTQGLPSCWEGLARTALMDEWCTEYCFRHTRFSRYSDTIFS